MLIGAAFPEPAGMSFVAWASVITEQLAEQGVPIATNESTWRDWVNGLLSTAGLAWVPRTEGFETWQQWADAFVGSNIGKI